MAGLTTLGVVHTAISLVAISCGFWALARDRGISSTNRLGRTYLATTLATAFTGLFIFQHGGFGAPHALSLLTIAALAVGTVAATSSLFGRAAPYVQAASYSSTMLFHMIPGVTESLTRLPPAAPVLPSAEAPEFQALYGGLLLLFVAGLTLQLRMLRARAVRS